MLWAEHSPRGLISLALSRTRNGISALCRRAAKVKPLIPPPEIKTLGLLKASISSRVMGSFGLPERSAIGCTGVAYSSPGRGSTSWESLSLGADIIRCLFERGRRGRGKEVAMAEVNERDEERCKSRLNAIQMRKTLDYISREGMSAELKQQRLHPSVVLYLYMQCSLCPLLSLHAVRHWQKTAEGRKRKFAHRDNREGSLCLFSLMHPRIHASTHARNKNEEDMHAHCAIDGKPVFSLAGGASFISIQLIHNNAMQLNNPAMLVGQALVAFIWVTCCQHVVRDPPPFVWIEDAASCADRTVPLVVQDLRSSSFSSDNQLLRIWSKEWEKKIAHILHLLFVFF